MSFQICITPKSGKRRPDWVVLVSDTDFQACYRSASVADRHVSEDLARLVEDRTPEPHEAWASIRTSHSAELTEQLNSYFGLPKENEKDDSELLSDD